MYEQVDRLALDVCALGHLLNLLTIFHVQYVSYDTLRKFYVCGSCSRVHVPACADELIHKAPANATTGANNKNSRRHRAGIEDSAVPCHRN